MGDRSQDEQDLRATTESITQDVDRLAELEEDKRKTDAADPRMDQLSSLAEDLGADVAAKSTAQRELSAKIEPTDHREEAN